MAGVSPLVLASMGASAVSGIQMLTQAPASDKYRNSMDALNSKSAIDARKQKADYARLSAQQRARFAAQGMSPTEGSSAALLEGMRTMTEANAADRARLNAIAQQRLTLDNTAAARNDLLAKKSPLFSDNLSKLLDWG